MLVNVDIAVGICDGSSKTGLAAVHTAGERRLHSGDSHVFYALIGIGPSSYFFHFNHIQRRFCNLPTQMPFWKPQSKLAGRVFAILRLRPTIDKDELEPTNGPAGHDRCMITRTSLSRPGHYGLQ